MTAFMRIGTHIINSDNVSHIDINPYGNEIRGAHIGVVFVGETSDTYGLIIEGEAAEIAIAVLMKVQPLVLD